MSGSWFPRRPPSGATVWRCGPSGWRTPKHHSDTRSQLAWLVVRIRHADALESDGIAAPVAEERTRTTSSESMIFIEHLCAYLLEQIADTDRVGTQ